ncbi:hypothetical protein CARUB_v10015356mg, partial [Capsella rubella]
IKMQLYAGFDNLTSQVTRGWIVHDHLGEAKFWGSAQFGYAHSFLEAQSKALLHAMQQIWFKGFTSMIFEGDCQVLNKIIKGSIQDVSMKGLL